MTEQSKKRLARVRLARVERLREIEAPAWVIKWEQVHLAIARRRVAYTEDTIVALYERHVFPRMHERMQ
jgi:hypothetical protein